MFVSSTMRQSGQAGCAAGKLAGRAMHSLPGQKGYPRVRGLFRLDRGKATQETLPHAIPNPPCSCGPLAVLLGPLPQHALEAGLDKHLAVDNVAVVRQSRARRPRPPSRRRTWPDPSSAAAPLPAAARTTPSRTVWSGRSQRALESRLSRRSVGQSQRANCSELVGEVAQIAEVDLDGVGGPVAAGEGFVRVGHAPEGNVSPE